jgi:hypothetical protein
MVALDRAQNVNTVKPITNHRPPLAQGGVSEPPFSPWFKTLYQHVAAACLLCISPDLDGKRGTTKMCPGRPTQGPDMFRYVFTICLCISPDLDGNRGTTKMCPGMFSRETHKGHETQVRYVSRYVCSLVRTWTGQGHPRYVHDMFV